MRFRTRLGSTWWTVDRARDSGTSRKESSFGHRPLSIRQEIDPDPEQPTACGTRPTRFGLATCSRSSAEYLRRVNASFPLGCFIAVTGPSGSGKSSLINDILHPALANKLHRAQFQVGPYEKIEGIKLLDKVILVNQSPLGSSPASNPATYSESSSIFAACLLNSPRHGHAVLRHANLASTYRADAARNVKAWGNSRLRCTSFRMFGSPARLVRGNAIPTRPLRYAFKGTPSTMCWSCRLVRPWI